MRTVAAALVSVAALAALAASGGTSPDGRGINSGSAPPQSAPKSPGARYTVSQQNAINAAKDYLSTAAFSKKGLIEQLSSSAGDGYPYKDAVFAVEHLHVSWDLEAVQAAKDYLHTSSFSCQGLIEQLSSPAGDNYTEGQAQYAAKEVGLC